MPLPTADHSGSVCHPRFNELAVVVWFMSRSQAPVYYSHISLETRLKHCNILLYDVAFVRPSLAEVLLQRLRLQMEWSPHCCLAVSDTARGKCCVFYLLFNAEPVALLLQSIPRSAQSPESYLEMAVGLGRHKTAVLPLNEVTKFEDTH